MTHLRYGLAFAFLLPSVLSGCSPESKAPPAPKAEIPAATPTPLAAVARPVPKTTSHVAQAKTPRKQKSVAEPTTNPRVTMNREGGFIRGRICWKGPVPTVPGDRSPHRQNQVIRLDQRDVVVQASPHLHVQPNSGGLAHVAVWLVEAPANVSAMPAGVVSLVQEHGAYRPQVMVAQRGARLQLRTSDDQADFHAAGVTSFSLRLTRGETRMFPLTHGGVVQIRSETHPWMTPATIHVLEHTHGTVTDTDGSFCLPWVPPGNYQLVMWHEGWRPVRSGDPTLMQPVRVQIPLKLAKSEGVSVEWTLPDPTLSLKMKDAE